MNSLPWFISIALVLAGCGVEGARLLDAKEQLEQSVSSRAGPSPRARREARRLSARDLMEADQDTHLQVKDVSSTAHGTKLWKMKETFRGKEVYDGQLTIETDPSGNEIIDAFGIFVQGIDEDTDGSVVIDSSEAVDSVLREFGDSREQARDIRVDIKVFIDPARRAFTGYQVEYKVEEEGSPRRPTAIVDGRDGRVLMSWNSMTSFCPSPNQGTGVGGNDKIGERVYNSSELGCLSVTRKGDVCYLENENVTVIDMGGEKWHNITGTMAYDCHNANDSINGARSPALDAFFIGNSAYKMFDEWYNMTPLVNMNLVIRVHFGQDYTNAFWNGVNATFGDGMGVFHPFVSLDLVGHEIGHALVEQHSGLIWFNQPGALNEAFADITGEVLEYYVTGTQDWLTGYDITKGQKAVRYFITPEENFMSISNMAQFVQYMEPHQTGGILAHAFYLIVDEGNQTMREAYEVFLHANRMYWHHMSSIKAGVCELMKSVYDLGRPGEVYRQAFESVGVEVCNVSDHVVGLHNNQTLTDVRVSNSTRPVFTFGVPGEWTQSIIVKASSAHGPVLITITDQTWMKAYEPEDVDILARDYDYAAVNVTFIGRYDVTITLSSDSSELWSDVSVEAGFTCIQEGQASHGYFEYLRKENCEGRSY